MSENSQYYLSAYQKGDGKFIPKYGIETDARWFDYNTLVEMYGQEAVDKFIKERRLAYA